MGTVMSAPSTLDVLKPGAMTLVQDLGRTGYAHLGVTGSGAADRGSLRLANRLLGNPEGTAGCCQSDANSSPHGGVRSLKLVA